MKPFIPWFLVIMAIGVTSEKCPIWWLPPLIIFGVCFGLGAVAFRSGMSRGAHF